MMNMRSRYSESTVGLSFIILTFAVFRQVRNHEFINYDDEDYVNQNRHIKVGWTREGVSLAFTSKVDGHWHPVTWQSRVTDCQFSELNPAAYHLSRLFPHIANTLILFLILNRITRALMRSAFVVALFRIDPPHVVPVGWVADRKDVSSATFRMLPVAGNMKGRGARTPHILLCLAAKASLSLPFGGLAVVRRNHSPREWGDGAWTLCDG